MLQCKVRLARLKNQITKPCRVMLARLKIIKPCRVMLGRLQTIKPCRVMLARKSLSAMQDKTVLQQFHLQPRSVRQRVENCRLSEKYNLGYQDDVFDQISPIKRKVGLLTTSSSSEDSFSVTSSSSSTGPILSWPVPRSSTPMKQTTQ